MNWKLFILFLIINFGALAIGGWLQGEGARSDWYQSLSKAPWTPPGWVFGTAWFSIMLFFSFYMARWVQKDASVWIWVLFAIQFLLNVLWNPMFFRWYEVEIALAMIVALFLLTGFMLIYNITAFKWWSLLVVPYVIWLGIATSLNAYVWLKN